VIARSDRGPFPKVKEMMESAKIKRTTDNVALAMDQMSKDISRTPEGKERTHPWWLQFAQDNRTPERRREDYLVKGTVSLFSGIALMIFLYYFAAALVLKIPPEILAKLPFEIEPLLKVIWLIGLIPTLSGLGRIIAGLIIKPTPSRTLNEAETASAVKSAEYSQPAIADGFGPEEQPRSVVENTTEMLDQKVPIARQ
ncbi:MAG TPA: hypothetical protein VKB86_05835, partial [Pyrinomonadaceae bacterium]|nr:hypothetical protein [Pyrinomonadaceae bacterium]